MNVLYILFTLVMDRHNMPIPNQNEPINALDKISFLRPITSISNGMDERFPLEEDMEHMLLQFHYLEQIRHLESSVRTLEEVIKDTVVREVLPLYDISPCRMKAGGLLDDWERNI